MAWNDNENKNIFGDILENENENDLDELFLENMPEYISDEMINDITPWRHATNMIIAGMAMSVVSFNILLLQYIIPFAGNIMCMLGFRALRKDNGYFGACYGISAFQLCARIPLLTVNATIYASQFDSSDAADMLSVATAVLRLIMLLLMRQGFITVRQRAGQGSSGGAMNALVVWYIIFMGLAYVNASGWIIFIVLIGAYIMIIRSLLSMARMIDTAGYAVHASEVRVSDRNVVIAAVAAVCVFIACGYLFFGGYAMDWQPVDNGNEYADDGTNAEQVQGENAAEHVGAPGAHFTQLQLQCKMRQRSPLGGRRNAVELHVAREDVRSYSVRKELLALGFPENVLDDMTYDDVMACAGAQRVVVWGTDLSLSDEDPVEIDLNGTTATTVYGKRELTLTDIGVELEGGRWKMIDHFVWNKKPPVGSNGSFYGTEALRINPVPEQERRWVPENDESSAEFNVSGRLLYDSGGNTYAAPYHYLGVGSYDQANFFFGPEKRNDIFAEFSLPRSGENRRGYIMYGIYDRASEDYELDESGGGVPLDAADASSGYADADEICGTYGDRMLYSYISYTHQLYWMRYPVQTASDALMSFSFSNDAFQTWQTSFRFNRDLPESQDDDAPGHDRRYSQMAVGDVQE